MSKPRALGYLRRDLSGARQQWDESQIRSLAARFGYDLCKTLTFGSSDDASDKQLRIAVNRTRAAAVFVPSATHFGPAGIPATLIELVDVVTVDTTETFTRPTSPRAQRRRWNHLGGGIIARGRAAGRDPATVQHGTLMNHTGRDRDEL
ncbi:hypothetical protein [Nocardia jejuensis]|uniref:hypothetical protein n=1 Tax=Nocardia jejuensis TaxID=328049 RepID=UPI000836557D|nr:hypothetical protein [Nocardia jejuensis]